MRAGLALLVGLAGAAVIAGGLALAEEGQSEPQASEETKEEEKKVPFIPLVDPSLFRRPLREAERDYSATEGVPEALAVIGQPWQPVPATMSFYDPVNGYFYYPGVRLSTVTITVGPAEKPEAVYYLEQGQAGLLSAEYYRSLLALARQAAQQRQAEAAAREQPVPPQPAREAEFGSRLAPMLGGPAKASLPFALGETRLQEGGFAEAVAAFRRAVAAVPGDPIPRMALCLALVAEGQYGAAARVLRPAVSVVSDWGAVKLDVGKAFGSVAAYERVEEKLLKTAGEDPANGDLWLLVGFQYMATGRPAEAARALQRGTEVRPQDLAVRALLRAAQPKPEARPAPRPQTPGTGGK